MPSFQLRKQFLFTKETKGQAFIKAVNDADWGFVVKWHVSRPTGIMFVEVEATSSRDLKQLARTATKMGAEGETHVGKPKGIFVEQGVPVSAAQTKVDSARKEREARKQETERKSREQQQDTEREKAAKQQQTSDRESKRTAERQAQDQKQAERQKKDDQIRKDAEQRRRDQTQRAQEREREQEAEPEQDSLAKTVAAAAAQGVQAALSKKDKGKKVKKEDMLSFGEYIKEQPANFAGQGTKIAGLGGDEPIVRRKKDCRKEKGQCVPLPIIVRRAGKVAESVMRQLKAKTIARSVMQEAKDFDRAFVFPNEPAALRFRNALRDNTDAFNIVVNRVQGQIEVTVTFSRQADASAARKLAQKQGGKLFREQVDEDFRPKRCKVCKGTGKDPRAGGARCQQCKGKGFISQTKITNAPWPRKRPIKEAKSQFEVGTTLLALSQRLNKERDPKKRARIQANIDRIKKERRPVPGRGKVKTFPPPPSKRGQNEDIETLDIPAEPTTQTYAGSPVFKVDPETFAKCCNGRAKWSRWARVLNLEDEGHAAIRTFANRYPSRPIVLQCNETGDLKFLRFNRKGGGGNRRRRKHALPTPTDGGTGQVVFDAEDKQITEGVAEDIVKFLTDFKRDRKARGLPVASGSKPSARELNGIINSADAGIEVLDYINTFFAFSDREWSKFVDGKRYKDLAGSRKPADKEKLAKAILKQMKP